MKGTLLLNLILNVVFTFTISPNQRWKRNLNDESNPTPFQNLTQGVHSLNFPQELDHYNPDNDKKWNQRYWVDLKNFKEGGPAFLVINGERNTNNPADFFARYVDSHAKELNASCFLLEHRFYGQSWPKIESLYYLSSDQAVADIANFISGVTLQFNLPSSTKWIVFGCSYAGTLAAWARLKYPHLIHGAVASSAALLAKVVYSEFDQIVEESLRSYDPKCVESISQASRDIVGVIKNNDTKDLYNIAKELNVCDENLENIASYAKDLYLFVPRIISEAVQYNNTSPFSIPVVCDMMMNQNGSTFETFYKLRKKYMEIHESPDLIDSNANDYIQRWDYIRCSEFGWFTSSNTSTLLFAMNDMHPIETYIKDNCEPHFGPNFGIEELEERISRTNLLYGGLDYDVENTLFIHGSLDPWYAAGLYKKTNGSMYETIFINGASHCADIEKPSDNDTPEVRNARRKVLETLKVWLKENP